MKYNTFIINLFAGPGAGKSTIATSIFSELKWKGFDCEFVSEFCKDLVWEGRNKTILNQVYIFGKQHHRLYRLNEQVECIITDSPLLLTPIYGNNNQILCDLALQEHKKFNNYNFFIKRKKKYNPNGRNQTSDEAKLIDEKIINYLNNYNIQYDEVDGSPEGVKVIVEKLEKIRNNFHDKNMNA